MVCQPRKAYVVMSVNAIMVGLNSLTEQYEYRVLTGVDCCLLVFPLLGNV
jgi:hypothetical protein